MRCTTYLCIDAVQVQAVFVGTLDRRQGGGQWMSFKAILIAAKELHILAARPQQGSRAPAAAARAEER